MTGEAAAMSRHSNRVLTVSGRPGEVAAIDQVRLMLRIMLADRFKLAVHNEIRELPVSALVMARKDGTLGRQLRKVEVDCAALRDEKSLPMLPEPDTALCGGSRTLGLGRLVLDRTGLTGQLISTCNGHPSKSQPPGVPDPPPADPNGVSIFTALQEQLGLKLESSKGPVDVLVIDHVERPTAD